MNLVGGTEFGVGGRRGIGWWGEGMDFFKKKNGTEWGEIGRFGCFLVWITVQDVELLFVWRFDYISGWQ